MKKLLDENPDIPCTLRGIDFAAKDVFDAARSGDALAAREVDEMTDTLGMALASIAATTDPEMFMIGGGVARAGEVLFDRCASTTRPTPSSPAGRPPSWRPPLAMTPAFMVPSA